MTFWCSVVFSLFFAFYVRLSFSLFSGGGSAADADADFCG